MAGRRQRSRVPWVLLNLFRLAVRAAKAGKVRYPSLECLAPTRPTLTLTRRVCGQAYGLGSPQRGAPFGALCELRGALSVGGVGASRSPLLWRMGKELDLTLFPSKWLKSSSTHFGE